MMPGMAAAAWECRDEDVAVKVPESPFSRRLDDTERARHLSRNHHENIRQNLFLHLLTTTHLACLWLQACFTSCVYGILLSPVIAAAAMALSSVSVIVRCVASEKCQAREITLSEGAVTNRRVSENCHLCA